MKYRELWIITKKTKHNFEFSFETLAYTREPIHGLINSLSTAYIEKSAYDELEAEKTEIAKKANEICKKAYIETDELKDLLLEKDDRHAKYVLNASSNYEKLETRVKELETLMKITSSSKYGKFGKQKCKAFQCSDQMVCEPCNISWDMNDSDPPKCKRLRIEE